MGTNHQQAVRRTIRTRRPVWGTVLRPRIALQRTSAHFKVQLINDDAGTTILSANDTEVGTKDRGMKQAAGVGTLLATKAAQAGIKQAVLDRRGYRYHGRVKAFAEAVRQAGITI